MPLALPRCVDHPAEGAEVVGLRVRARLSVQARVELVPELERPDLVAKYNYGLRSRGLRSYGLHSYGLCSYCLYSYGPDLVGSVRLRPREPREERLNVGLVSSTWINDAGYRSYYCGLTMAGAPECWSGFEHVD